MRNAVALFSILIVLSACIPLQELRDGQMVKWSSSAGSSASDASSSFPENIEMVTEIEEASSSSVTGSGALAERLTPDGFLLIGNADAPHTLTVFTNASCAYCREFHTTMFQRLADEFLASGRLNMQIAIVPLKKYPDSAVQAAALLCSTAQEKGLAMLNILTGTTTHDRKSVIALAKTIGLPQKAFITCLDSKETKNILATQQGLIAEHGVTLIPEFLLDTEKKVGLPSYADLRGWIRERLAR